MKEVLQDIYIGRLSLDSIEFRYSEIEVPLYRGEDREFQIFIKNFAASTYISFLPDDSIRDYIIMVPSKHHIQNNEYARIVIRIPYSSKPVAEGMFYVVTGYGAQKKGFRLSVGSGKSRSSTLSESDAFPEEDTANNSGSVYASDSSANAVAANRVPFIKDDDDEDETAQKQKPPFAVREDWNENRNRKDDRFSGATANSEKYKQKKEDRHSRAAHTTHGSERNGQRKEEWLAGTEPDPDRYKLRKEAESLTFAEKVSFFTTVIVIALLASMFTYIQFTETDSVFSLSQEMILALMVVSFVIFIIILLSMFLKRTRAGWNK
jgi:hypothetical protein